jgi:hypothetical protein
MWHLADKSARDRSGYLDAARSERGVDLLLFGKIEEEQGAREEDPPSVRIVMKARSVIGVACLRRTV